MTDGSGAPLNPAYFSVFVGNMTIGVYATDSKLIGTNQTIKVSAELAGMATTISSVSFNLTFLYSVCFYETTYSTRNLQYIIGLEPIVLN